MTSPELRDGIRVGRGAQASDVFCRRRDQRQGHDWCKVPAVFEIDKGAAGVVGVGTRGARSVVKEKKSVGRSRQEEASGRRSLPRKDTQQMDAGKVVRLGNGVLGKS